MPRSKEQYEEMRKATENKIITAAMHLFVEKGFAAANVQGIADLAGISIGLLYKHYRTKEELFNSLVEYALAGVQKIIEQFELEASPKKLIDTFINEIYNDLTTGEELANLMILIKQAIFSGAAVHKKDEVIKRNTNMLKVTAELIKKGQECGEFSSGDPYQKSVFFYSAIQGLAEAKVAFKSNFVMPSKSIFTSFLYR
jgi:AcrR family transcriptional regulator